MVLEEGPPTFSQLLDVWVRRVTDAEAINATALVGDVMRPMIQEARNLDEPSTRSGTKWDRHISVAEAADRIGMSRRWIYRHADTLSFIRRNGSRTVRCSERALERWMAKRTTLRTSPVGDTFPVTDNREV